MLPFDDSKEFAALRAERQARHGLSIAYIKRKVGAGTEYANEVARAVLSPHGGYYELAEMPEEFAGALGENVAHRLIGAGEARETLTQIQTLTERVLAGTEQARILSLYVLYAGGSLRTRQEMFVCDCQKHAPPFSHGAWRPGILPRFFKMRFEAEPGADVPSGLPRSGVVFFLLPKHASDGHALLATLTRTPGSVDLGAPTMPNTRH